MAINNAINQYPIVDALLGSWTPGAGTITSADSILTAMQKISGSSVSLSGNNVWTGTNSFGNTVTFSTLTASTVPYLDASKNLTSSAVTPTELGYVSGVTSAIQTQLNAKAPTANPTFTGTVTIPTPFTLGAVSVTTTGTQLNYINIATGVTGTGSIVLSASPTLTGTVGTSAITISTSAVLSTSGTQRVATGVTAALQIEGTGYNTSSASIICNNSNSSIFPILIFGRSNGASVGSQTIVVDDDILGGIYFTGSTGSNLQATATISCLADGTWGASDSPSRLEFSTVADGGLTIATKMVINNVGSVTLGAISGTGTGAFYAGTGSFTDDVTITGQKYIKDSVQPTYNYLQLRNSAGNMVTASQVGMYFVLDVDNTNVGSFNVCDQSTSTIVFSVDYTGACSMVGSLVVGGSATATAVGLEIGNTAGGTPYIDFKSSAVDYNVRIINGTATTLSFMGATGGYFFDTTVNSIYAKVATTANATLTTITQGLTIAGNLVTSAYVTDGYTAGLTWSSTDDNASKPKAGIFSRTTGSGSYIFFGTSNAYVTGIVNTVSVGPDGDIAANRYSATSTATTQNVIFAQGDSLTTGKLGYFYSNSVDTNSRSLVSIVNDSSAATGTTALNIQQDSTGNALTITQAGALATNKDGLLLNCTGANTNGNTSAMYVLQNNVSSTAPAIRVLHTGNGRGLSMTVSNTTDNALDIIASSMTTGRGASIYSNSSSASQFVLLDLISANASATGMIPLAIANAASVSTNYKIMMYLGGNFIYKSNGTTPNGFLSGSAGDICIGADSGKAYYCVSGTSWTAM